MIEICCLNLEKKSIVSRARTKITSRGRKHHFSVMASSSKSSGRAASSDDDYMPELRSPKKKKVTRGKKRVAVVIPATLVEEPSSVCNDQGVGSSAANQNHQADLLPDPLPELNCTVYKPSTTYYDLGYVVDNLTILGIDNDRWRTKCFTFSFTVNQDEYTTKNLEGLCGLNQFRLLYSPTPGESMILVPRTATRNPDILMAYKGTVHLLGDEGGVPATDLIETERQRGRLQEFLEALRHYVCIPSTNVDNHIENILVPPRPIWTGLGFELNGVAYKWDQMPRLLDPLSKNQQQLCFVRRLEENPDSLMDIFLDAYMTDQFFDDEKNADFYESSETHHDIKNTRRLQQLLNSGRKITVKGM